MCGGSVGRDLPVIMLLMLKLVWDGLQELIWNSGPVIIHLWCWSGPRLREGIGKVSEGAGMVAPSCIVRGLYSWQFLTNSDIWAKASPANGTCVELPGHFENHDPRMWSFKHPGTPLIDGTCALWAENTLKPSPVCFVHRALIQSFLTVFFLQVAGGSAEFSRFC